MRKLHRLCIKLHRIMGRNIVVNRQMSSTLDPWRYTVYDLDSSGVGYHGNVIGRFFTVHAVESFLLSLFR